MNEYNIFKLDSAAIAYPYFASRKAAYSFTLEATLDEDINYQALHSAAQKLYDRFPSMFVRLKKCRRGYELEHGSDVSSYLKKISFKSLKPFEIKDGNNLIYISYNRNVIYAEFFHAVTDGNGGLVFFKSLLAEYLRNLGIDIPCTNGVLSPNDLPKECELEDSYKANYDKKLGTVNRMEKFAFQPKTDNSNSQWRRSNLIINLSDLKSLSKKHNATITQLIVSVYIYAFYLLRTTQKSKKNIAVAVPINLRSTFNSDSLRNFSLYFLAKLPAGKINLETILEQVKKDFASGCDKTLLQKMINTNVSQQEMLFFRLLPRFMKKIVLKTGFQLYGERLYTSTLSNIGVINLPQEMKKHIISFRGMLGPVLINRIHCMAYCYNDVFSVTFTSRLNNSCIEDAMVQILSQHGIEAKLVFDKYD